ncbi:helix-turn-helix domain-containing protein [Niveibacterium sp. 24ML]|uniref:helix-turn-helix domain-containing protein n=1 Tax=Niveibacterium sp. 24ML TaxID=2985512 RepID=UPI0022717775|nr:helix-turn-helix transcriptional regulator [Niveibacterium sp. 24ML]MCX9154993.1 helix-turn-helix domain-containing protein [Niveibacterium sp. 24ML]
MPRTSRAIAALPTEAAAKLIRLGERLRAHRTLSRWTVQEMAARIFCSPGTYRALEAGKPTTSTGVLMNALWLLGQADTLDAVAPAPAALAAGRRVRRKAGTSAPGVISEDERDF